MSKVLIKHKDNWADEIDLEGFSIMESDAWNKRKEDISNMTKPFTVYVGTNEEIDYKNGNAFLRTLTVKEITDTEFNFLKTNFGIEFGHCPIDNLCEDCDDEDEDNGFFIDSNGQRIYWYSGMELDIVDGEYKGKFAIVVGTGDEHEDLEIASPTMCIFVYGIPPKQEVYEDPDDERSEGNHVIIDSKLIRRRESIKPSRWSQNGGRTESFGDYEKRVAEMLKDEK